MTKIEWVVNPDGSQGKTWNPLTGCTKVSAGCKNCFAETLARRLKAMGQPQYQKAVNGKGHWTGEITLIPEKLMEPLRWRKPRRVFVNSMSDLFHEDVPFDFILKAFSVMWQAHQHIFQVLTKRPARMLEFVEWMHGDEPLRPLADNVQLGVSVENQKAADERIPYLLQTPAAVRFLSCEPLLGEIDLDGYIGTDLQLSDYDSHIGDGVDWIILGCESGPQRRPMELAWARSLVNQCRAAGVAVFVKQLPINGRVSHDPDEWPEDLRVREWPSVDESTTVPEEIILI